MPRTKVYEFGNFSVYLEIEQGYIGRYEVWETTKIFSNGTYGVVVPKNKLLLVTTDEKEAIGKANGGNETLAAASNFIAQKRYCVKATDGKIKKIIVNTAGFDTIQECIKFASNSTLPQGCDRWRIWDNQEKMWAVQMGGTAVKKLEPEQPLYLLPFN